MISVRGHPKVLAELQGRLGAADSFDSSAVVLTDEDRAAIARSFSVSIAARRIAHEIAAQANLDAEMILGRSRLREIAHARQLVMFVLRRAGAGIAEIGRALGLDHTTVLHGLEAEEKRRAPRVCQ